MNAVQSGMAAPPSLLQSAGTLPERVSPVPASDAAPAPQAEVRQAMRLEEAVRPTREAVDQAARHIEEFVRSVGRSLDFSVDSSTGRSVLRVVDPQSGEVIRQLPPEKTIRIARAVEYMQSMLVHQRA